MKGILKLLFLILLLAEPGHSLVGQSADSSYRFTTIHPKQNQTMSDEVIFSWNLKSGATSYDFQLSTELNFNNFLINESNIKESVFELNIETSDKYYWRVIAKNGSKNLDTTRVAEFLVFSPKSIDSLSLWLIGDSVNLSAINRVSSWYDLSDTANVLTQVNSARQPDFIPNYINGYAVVDFPDSRPSVFTTVCDISIKNYYVSSVYNWHGPTGVPTRFINSQTAGNLWNLGPNNVHSLREQNGLVGAGLPIEQDRFVLNTAYAIDDSVSNIINGVLIGKVATARAPQVIRISIGNGEKMNGAVAEIIAYTGSISKNDQEKVDNYLMDKYSPPINLGPDRILCNLPDSINLVNDYVVNYSWSTGDTTNKAIIDSAGKYYLTITDMFERTSVDSMWFILDTSNFQADFGFEDSTLCLGDSLVLNAGPDRYSYSWNTLDTINSISVKTSGVYTVDLENCKNQMSSDSVTITFNNPEFSLGLDTSACFNEPLQLEADSAFINANFQWSTGETSASIIADSSGLYSLLVTDDFGCSYSDTIDVSIDSSLFGTTLGSDTSLCEGNFIGLINPDSSINSYLWGTGNTATTQLVDTSGNYFVKVSNSKCSISDTIAVTIKGFAPSAQFSLSNFCFQDTLKFIDSSTSRIGDTLTSWQWDFGDGFSSNQRNTAHVYTSVQSYKVLLEVTTDKNCSDTVSQFINIKPKPQANFGIINAISCSKEEVFFTDSSNISSGTINDYLWVFNDSLGLNDSSKLREPSYTFDTLGVYTISLIVRSSQGCLDTIVKQQFINPTPSVSFGYSGSCLNDSTFFTNQTILPQGNFESFLWATNGQLNLKENPVFKYLSSGSQNVSLRVRSQAGCESTLVSQIEIFESPVAEFLAPIACFEDSLQIEDASSSVDSIAEYRYVFNGLDTSFLRNPSFATSNIGNFPLQLKVNSVNGCEDSTVKQITVSPKPKAAFEILNNGSGVPFKIALNNNSKNADRYIWDFDNGDSSLMETPNYIYRDTGSFNLKLKVLNTNNCLDSISKKVTVIPSYLDALIDKVILSENSNGELIVSARIINTGSNTIESIKLSANLNNQYQINETFERTVFRGNSSIYTLTGSFNKGVGEKLDFVCLNIEKVNNVEDELLSNNQLCEKAFNEKIVLNVYPNPASEFLIMEYVLPLDGELKIRVFDQLGRTVLDEFKSKIESGFYQTNFNVTRLQAGLYYYSFSINGEDLTGSFVKR